MADVTSSTCARPIWTQSPCPPFALLSISSPTSLGAGCSLQRISPEPGQRANVALPARINGQQLRGLPAFHVADIDPVVLVKMHKDRATALNLLALYRGGQGQPLRQTYSTGSWRAGA